MRLATNLRIVLFIVIAALFACSENDQGSGGDDGGEAGGSTDGGDSGGDTGGTDGGTGDGGTGDDGGGTDGGPSDGGDDVSSGEGIDPSFNLFYNSDPNFVDSAQLLTVTEDRDEVDAVSGEPLPEHYLVVVSYKSGDETVKKGHRIKNCGEA